MHQLIIHRVWRILSIRRKNSKFRQNRVSNVNFSPRITKTHCISKILQTLYMFSQCTIIGLRSGWNWQYIPDFVESRYFFLPAWPANRHSAALDFPEHTTGTYLNVTNIQRGTAISPKIGIFSPDRHMMSESAKWSYPPPILLLTFKEVRDFAEIWNFFAG